MLNRPAQLNCVLQNIVQLCLRRGSSKATKFYCDFKFRSATFNEGYVGGDIIVGMTKTPGYEILNSLKRVYFYLVRGKRYQNGFRISSSSQQTIGD